MWCCWSCAVNDLLLLPVIGCGELVKFLVPDSSGVKDALGDTNPPASPVLHCLLYLVPSDPYLLEILADDSLQFWRGRPGLLLKPSGSQWWARRGSYDWHSMRERCPSHLSRLHNYYYFFVDLFLYHLWWIKDCIHTDIERTRGRLQHHPRLCRQTWVNDVRRHLMSLRGTLNDITSTACPLFSVCYARFPLPELTARVDGWPVSITRQRGPCWRARVSNSRVDGPSTRPVLTGNGNRSPVNSGR